MWNDIKKEEGYCSTLRKVERQNTNRNTENDSNKKDIPYETVGVIVIIIVGIIIKTFK